MVKLYNFKTRGLGVITTEEIPTGFFIGSYMRKYINQSSNSRLIYNGWVETNPLGRYINHNRSPNTFIKEVGDSLNLISKEKINGYSELTINYFDVAKTLKIPQNKLTELGVVDYDYVEEVVDKVVNLI